jgi:hypothetical protein
MAAGRYFKWAAYDDMCAPTYLERCIDILDNDPSVLVCHSQTIYIDTAGTPYAPPGAQDDHLDLRAPQPHQRLHAYLFRPSDRWNAIFGLIRTEELKKTPLIGSYPLSDQVLLGELALRGKIYRVPEPLFLRRDHPKTAMKANRTDNAYAVWFNAANRGKIILPRYLKAFLEYLRTVRRVELTWQERMPGYLSILQWGVQYVLWKPVALQSGRVYRLLTSVEKRKQLMKTVMGK